MTKLTQAVDILRAGGLVAFPTETVYGLGADASCEKAVEKIFSAKERPHSHPLIVHIAEVSQLSNWACDIPPLAFKLAQEYWPGPLTLILKKQPHVLDSVTGGQDSVGLRIPRHPQAQALLKMFGGGIAAPSANKFTHISPTTAAAVYEELGDSVDLILDGGECEVGVESTIIDLTQAVPVVLRPGMITTEALSALLDQPIQQKEKGKLRVPGAHALHYAPQTKTLVLPTIDIPLFLASLKQVDYPLAILSHEPLSLPTSHLIHQVEMPREAHQYAHVLYQTLRALDNQAFQSIIISSLPSSPAWEAIRDRIGKASSR